MFNKIFARLSEPSSFAGLAAILYGSNEVVKAKELQPLAETATQAGEMVAATGSPVLGLAVLAAGALAIFKGEKK